jgi:hypothetical protein
LLATLPDNSLQGWQTRDGRSVIRDGTLQIRSKRNSEKQIFIATARLDLPARLTAVVRLRTLRTLRTGRGGIWWRESGQKGFEAKAIATFDCIASAQLQEHRVNIVANKK